jgi:putative heme transporter
VVAISTGGVLAGVVGALLAVPTVAFFNNAFQVLLAEDPSAAAKKTDDDAAIMQAEPDELEPESETAD